MFNKKITKRIETLEEKVEKLSFMIKNKPKYEVGETVKSFLIIDRKCVMDKRNDRLFELFNILPPNILAFWSYRCYDHKSKKIISFKESKLIKMSKSSKKTNGKE